MDAIIRILHELAIFYRASKTLLDALHDPDLPNSRRGHDFLISGDCRESKIPTLFASCSNLCHSLGMKAWSFTLSESKWRILILSLATFAALC